MAVETVCNMLIIQYYFTGYSFGTLIANNKGKQRKKRKWEIKEMEQNFRYDPRRNNSCRIMTTTMKHVCLIGSLFLLLGECGSSDSQRQHSGFVKYRR